MEIKIKKLNSNAIIPTYGTEFSAGADLYSCMDEDLLIKSGETVMIKTGISLEIPEGLVGLVYARSGLAYKKGIAPSNKVGVIDSDYRGEIMVALHNHSKEDYVIERFERIAQLVITPYIKADFIETETLNDTLRDKGGFGSTGKK
ncbi:dUTP diphosphatase [Streptobacillus moniliformis]|uniref:Deoxyuridine 5'-triphosphate nucleotidohydrolase n=1 Tax=Streptobacillus moniliformis (strain ATCC 14647 / DSM 12112 / NCTC 10651 / 9901) TaxID=519441 RepID=D1AXP1_STRM9|nr:dUTP diphosphatase [Streptobacillus moniliformis]ACZ01067.1 deoxyuridine 5'-triphosphate nucleotidohydrolase Dut [Streptobacillus moniliformis DSM 12112]AVL42566.1 dUTP diphosphatase [Streptobacillus moniliformis]QXW65840.1 dUTP diphosphatase [Streptobacillus moniliformis]SQA13791.1 Deoxyuridine 5'-triphosphate nucleotidohydrolase [Streptobacillus moniliformis]